MSADVRSCDGTVEVEVFDPATGDVVDVQEMDCGFEDEVSLSYDGNRHSGTAHWTCPRCGKEHEEEYGPDPDDERDRMLDRMLDRYADQDA